MIPDPKATIFRLVHKLSWFTAVGLAVGIIYIGVSSLLGDFLGVAAQVATAVGVTASSFVSYVGHRYLTFRAQGSHFVHIRRFLIQIAAGYAINASLTYLFNEVVRLPVFTTAAIISVVIPVVNFIIYQFYTFRPA